MNARLPFSDIGEKGLCLALKARSHISLGQRPRILTGLWTSAESAIQRTGWPSIPDILLIEFNAVLAQQLSIFFLKSASAMVLFLRLHVLQHGIELARANRESRITALPEKAAIASVKTLNPFRGRFLYFFDHLGLGKSSRERRHDMNVITHAVDVEGFAAAIAVDRREIRVHARAYAVVEPRLLGRCPRLLMKPRLWR